MPQGLHVLTLTLSAYKSLKCVALDISEAVAVRWALQGQRVREAKQDNDTPDVPLLIDPPSRQSRWLISQPA